MWPTWSENKKSTIKINQTYFKKIGWKLLQVRDKFTSSFAKTVALEGGLYQILCEVCSDAYIL